MPLVEQTQSQDASILFTLTCSIKPIAAFLKVTVNGANLRVSETAAGMQEGRDMGQGKVLQR